MNPYIFIPAALFVAAIAYVVVMNKRLKAAKADINIDQERAYYTTYKTELLHQDFSFLTKWMNGKTIDAFSAASIPQSTASKVQTLVGDGLKNIVLSGVGVRLQRVETDAYWVLSGKDLHFLTTNTDGELDEHLIFDNLRIQKAQLKYGGVHKAQLGVYAKQAEAYLPQIHIITFDIDGKPLSLEIHDRLKYTPDGSDMLNMKKQLQTRAKYQVVGERFLTELQSRFPHLITA